MGEKILLGETTSEEILANFPELKEEYSKYQVNVGVLDSLRNQKEQLKIFAILGTWCNDSHREVSRLMKVMDSIENNTIDVSFYGLDRSKKDEIGISESFNITSVPTFVVLINGGEIGRIVERPARTLEEDLKTIINNSK